MATVSKSSIKVSTYVTATHTGTGTTTLYTVPASSYAIVQVACVQFGTSLTVEVLPPAGAQTIIYKYTAAGQSAFSIYLGPGAVLKMVAGAAGNQLDLSGVEFVNS